MNKIYKAPNVDFRYARLAELIPDPNGGADFKFKPLNAYTYESTTYVDKFCTINLDDYSDGASGAFDIESLGWWVHDQLCKRCKWDDGTPITNWEASTVLYDILKSEGRWCRARYWRYSTFLLGGKEIKKQVGWC